MNPYESPPTRHGDDYRAMGAGVRTKKIVFLGVNVYAVALYVEAEKAARELGIRDRGGFFDNDDDFCSALVDGAFGKALVIQLVRDVGGATFVEALTEALRPRMALAGGAAFLFLRGLRLFCGASGPSGSLCSLRMFQN